MVALIYLGIAAGCGWLALRAWMERSQQATSAFITVCLQVALAFIFFSLYLSGVPPLRLAYGVVISLLPFTVQGVLERHFGDVHPTPTYTRLRAVLVLAVLLFLVAEPLIGSDTHTSGPEIAMAVLALGAFSVPLRRLWREQRGASTLAGRARARILLGLLVITLLFAAVEMVSRAFPTGDPAHPSGAHNQGWALQGQLPPLSVLAFFCFLYVLHKIIAGALDVREITARTVAVSGASAALVLVQGLTVDLLGSADSFWTHRAFLLFLVAWGFLFFYDPIQRRLTQSTAELFNRPGWRLLETLQEVNRSLARVLSLDGLGPALLEPLQASGRAPNVALYLWQPELGLYRCVLDRGSGENDHLRSFGPRPFTDGFLRGSAAYARHELLRDVRRLVPGHEEAADRLRVMDAMGADLVLPFISGGEVVGWLALTAQDPGEGFGPDEIRQLRGTVDRVATVLENMASMEQLSEQRRLAALGTMAAGLAHEIRNPLAGIKGAAQYLQGQARPDEVNDFLGIIVDEVNRLSDVVSQFLDYARPLKVNREPSNLTALVNHVLEIVKREGLPSDLALRVEAPADLPEIPLDRDKMKQVLLNLVQNAVQAVGTRPGEVSISIGTQRVRLAEGRTEELLALTVTDTGRGIAPEDLEKLFVPFFTTRQGGTGLGLAISQRLVQAHGGDIAVRAQPGGPTAFTVRLPCYSDGSLPLVAPLTEPRSPSIPR